jgi:hypothetical protein
VLKLRRRHVRELLELDELLETLPVVFRDGRQSPRPDLQRQHGPKGPIAQPRGQRFDGHGRRRAE